MRRSARAAHGDGGAPEPATAAAATAPAPAAAWRCWCMSLAGLRRTGTRVVTVVGGGRDGGSGDAPARSPTSALSARFGATTSPRVRCAVALPTTFRLDLVRRVAGVNAVRGDDVPRTAGPVPARPSGPAAVARAAGCGAARGRSQSPIARVGRTVARDPVGTPVRAGLRVGVTIWSCSAAAAATGLRRRPRSRPGELAADAARGVP